MPAMQMLGSHRVPASELVLLHLKPAMPSLARPAVWSEPRAAGRAMVMPDQAEQLAERAH